MNGKVCVITGANSGIGKETARGIAELGGHVVMVCRNVSKAEAAASDIRRTAKGAVEIVIGDLASLAGVRAVARELTDRHPAIDVLVSNAGVYRLRRTLTVDGFEEMFAVNHLAPFLLTNLLLDTLKASAPSRIVIVASGAHHGATLDFDDLQSERGYKAMGVYSKSKLGNVMFTYALARRLEGTDVTVNCLHPGFVATNLGSGNIIPVKPVMAVLRLFVRGPKKGAETAVYLASSHDVEAVSGKYFFDQTERRSSTESRDVAKQEQLWDISTTLTNLA